MVQTARRAVLLIRKEIFGRKVTSYISVTVFIKQFINRSATVLRPYYTNV